MNPFVNPTKRSVLLPKGYKDLGDVLRDPKRAVKSPIRRFINLVLMQAQADGATDLIFGFPANEKGETPLRYKVDGIWHELAPFPSEIRQPVVRELRRMAGLTKARFPLDGVVSLQLSNSLLVWRLRIAGPDAECILSTGDV